MTSFPETPDPPRISYRRIREEESQGPEEEKRGDGTKPYAEVVNLVFTILIWVILAVVLVGWAVVGAIFWIPLMVRAMLRFSFSLVEATFEGRKPAAAAKGLRDAVNFYRRGFVVAVEVVTGEEIEDPKEGRTEDKRLLREFLWALLVWYFIALLFGWVQASPRDLVDWFLSIPWADYFNDLVDRLTGGRV